MIFSLILTVLMKERAQVSVMRLKLLACLLASVSCQYSNIKNAGYGVKGRIPSYAPENNQPGYNQTGNQDNAWSVYKQRSHSVPENNYPNNEPGNQSRYFPPEYESGIKKTLFRQSININTGSNQPGNSNPGYNEPENSQLGYEKPRDHQPGYNEPGRNRPPMNHPETPQDGYPRYSPTINTSNNRPNENNPQGKPCDNEEKPGMQTHPETEVGVCYIEVPTASLVPNYARPPRGNGSRPDLSRVRHCCVGYARNIHNHRLCDPICSMECHNALCSAPETCTCYPDYVKNEADECVPTCPIGCQNGQCSGGECICNEGWTLDREGKFCLPVCRNNCGEKGRCIGPNRCYCEPGYESKDGICKPVCMAPCVGECVAPNECKCQQGYTKGHNGLCVARCAPDCGLLGHCVGPNICIYPSTTTYRPYIQNHPYQPPFPTENQTTSEHSKNYYESLYTTTEDPGAYYYSKMTRPGYLNPLNNSNPNIPHNPSLPQNHYAYYPRQVDPNPHPPYAQNPNERESQYPDIPKPYTEAQSPDQNPLPENPYPLSLNQQNSNARYPDAYNANRQNPYPTSHNPNPDQDPKQQDSLPRANQFPPSHYPYPGPSIANNSDYNYKRWLNSQNVPPPFQTTIKTLTPTIDLYPHSNPEAYPYGSTSGQNETKPYQPYYPVTNLPPNREYYGENRPENTQHAPANRQINSQENNPPPPRSGYPASNQSSSDPNHHQGYAKGYQTDYDQPNYDSGHPNTYNEKPLPNAGYQPGFAGNFEYNSSLASKYPMNHNSLLSQNSYINRRYPVNPYPSYPDPPVDKRLVPLCSEPCINGFCSDVNRCTCNNGYMRDPMDLTGARCIPFCYGGCPNGVCTAPNFCICNFGYKKEHLKGSVSCVKYYRHN